MRPRRGRAAGPRLRTHVAHPPAAASRLDGAPRPRMREITRHRRTPPKPDESPTRAIPTQVARAMKLAVCLLAAPVAGLVAPAAPARTATVLNAEMSKALPFLTAPKGLKGYIGEEAGFDPVGFAEIMDIKWMREAEIKHGRVAMLATIGYTYPEMPWFAQAFPGDAYSHSNPIKAALAVPPEAWAQVVLFCGVMERVAVRKQKFTPSTRRLRAPYSPVYFHTGRHERVVGARGHEARAGLRLPGQRAHGRRDVDVQIPRPLHVRPRHDGA